MKSDLAVIDTNILVSSLIGNAGYSRKIFDEFITTGKIKLCLSEAVFEEYKGVLRRERFKRYPGFTSAANKLLEKVNENALWFKPKTLIDILSDKDDNKFIELAIEAEAAYIVTGNSNDFTLKTFRGITICSPKEYYELHSNF